MVGIAVIAGLCYGSHLCHTSDDGFITYRYARNLAGGHGLVFNIGEEHLGTTAPGWSILLGTLARVFGTDLIPFYSGVLSTIALFASAFMASRLLLPGNLSLFAITAALLAPNRWLIEVLGHEGFAQTFLAIVAITMLVRNKLIYSGSSWAGAILVRPDAGFMGALVGIDHWRRTRRFPLMLLATCVVLCGVGAVVLLWLSGTIVPISLQVKLSAAEGSNSTVMSYCSRTIGWFWRCWGWSGIPLMILGLGGWTWLISKHQDSSLRLLLPAVGMLVFYPLVGVPFAPWYLTFPILLLVVGAAAAVLTAIQGQSKLVGVAGVALAVLSAVVPSACVFESFGEYPDPRAVKMIPAAEWLMAHSNPDDQVAAVEIGLLAWECDRPILDLIGLGSPGALKAYESGDLASFFLEHSPRFLVYDTTFTRYLEPLIGDQEFQDRYTVVWKNPESPKVTILERTEM
jgi:hypothetical protein